MPGARVVAPPEARGERVDAFLARQELGLSRSRLKQLIEQGQVTVAGVAVHAALRLKGGEALELTVPAPEPATPVAQDLPLTIVFQDKHLLVLDKPAGLVVHPGAGNRDGTLVNALLHHVKDLEGVGGELRPGLVHRLDKDTSGLMVVAKHERALAALQAAFQARDVDKRYLALVRGIPEPPEGTFRTLHGRHPTQRLRFTGKVRTGKSAVTHYRVDEVLVKAALVEATLETGRTHQIRMHLSEAGHPIFGDALYGGVRRDEARVIDRQALHAFALGFAHPVSGKALRFEARPPKDFRAALVALRRPRG